MNNVGVSDHDQTDAPAAVSAVSTADQGEPGSGTSEQTPKQKKVKKERSTVRRITFWVGIGMILAGLSLVCYVAWQLWGTNWVSKRHQREITSELQEDWAAGAGKAPQFVPTGEASALIRIPKFGKDYVVPVLEGSADGTISQDILSKGYGHFASGAPGGGTAFPGAVGNYALAAHRVTHGEPLRKMPELRPGDKVIVETVNATFTYQLDTNPNDLVIPFTGVWVLDPLPKNPDGGPEPKQTPGQRLITLTTCSEIFHTDNRMIAFGHLISARPKTGVKASPAPAADD